MRALIALLLLTTAAGAANLNLPTKAAPAYPTTRCGGYLGVVGEGFAGSVSGAQAGMLLTGGNIGGAAGWACPTATFPWFIEGLATWQNLGSSAGNFALNGPFHGEIRGGVQTDLLQLLPQILPGTGAIVPSLPTPTPPVLPPGASVSGPAVNYVYAAGNFDDISASFGNQIARNWMISPEVGTGILTPVKLANGKPIVIDTWLGAEFDTNSICLGQFACPKLNTRWKVGGGAKF